MKAVLDLHNHSCLSPCGSLDLSPSVLARLLASRGVGVAALTDHNTALNLKAWAIAARREGVTPIFGMEAQTLEEVHVVCLFGELDAAESFGEICRGLLPETENDVDSFGDQVYVDEDENVLGEEPLWLGNSLDVDLDGLCSLVGGSGGIVIPAHVDRPAFAMISQLGFVPEGPWAALETMRWPAVGLPSEYPVISGSDAHYPEHVARRPFVLETAVDFFAAGGVDVKALAEALKEGSILHGASAGRVGRP